MYGLVFRPRFTMWGLPSTWWFVMGGTMAAIVIVVSFLWRDK